MLAKDLRAVLSRRCRCSARFFVAKFLCPRQPDFDAGPIAVGLAAMAVLAAKPGVAAVGGAEQVQTAVFDRPKPGVGFNHLVQEYAIGTMPTVLGDILKGGFVEGGLVGFGTKPVCRAFVLDGVFLPAADGRAAIEKDRWVEAVDREGGVRGSTLRRDGAKRRGDYDA